MFNDTPDGQTHFDPVAEYKATLLDKIEGMKYKEEPEGSGIKYPTANPEHPEEALMQYGFNQALDKIKEIIQD